MTKKISFVLLVCSMLTMCAAEEKESTQQLSGPKAQTEQNIEQSKHKQPQIGTTDSNEQVSLPTKQESGQGAQHSTENSTGQTSRDEQQNSQQEPSSKLPTQTIEPKIEVEKKDQTKSETPVPKNEVGETSSLQQEEQKKAPSLSAREESSLQRTDTSEKIEQKEGVNVMTPPAEDTKKDQSGKEQGNDTREQNSQPEPDKGLSPEKTEQKKEIEKKETSSETPAPKKEMAEQPPVGQQEEQKAPSLSTREEKSSDGSNIEQNGELVDENSNNKKAEEQTTQVDDQKNKDLGAISGVVPVDVNSEKPVELFSFRNAQQWCGAHSKEILVGVAAVVLIGGVVYVLYNNGTLKKLSDWVKENPKKVVTGMLIMIVAAVAYQQNVGGLQKMLHDAFAPCGAHT